MADELTLKSPGAGALTPSPLPSDEAATRARQDDELARSKAALQERHGRILSEAQARAFITRRQGREAERRAAAESKQAFEARRARESLTTGGAGPELRAQRAAGAREARGADGLTPEQRRAIASDTKAPPTLPPVQARALTPEQARAVLGKALAFLELDGSKLDSAALVRSAPAHARLSAAASASLSAPHPSLSGPAHASLSAPARAALSTPASDRNEGAARGDASASVADAEPTEGAARLTRPAFDGMRFNWDAFFSQFLVRSIEDVQQWRRMMRELRRLAAETALSGVDVALALLGMRQQLARAETVGKLGKALADFPARAERARAEEALRRLWGAEGGAARSPAQVLEAQRQWDESAMIGTAAEGAIAGTAADGAIIATAAGSPETAARPELLAGNAAAAGPELDEALDDALGSAAHRDPAGDPRLPPAREHHRAPVASERRPRESPGGAPELTPPGTRSERDGRLAAQAVHLASDPRLRAVWSRLSRTEAASRALGLGYESAERLLHSPFVRAVDEAVQRGIDLSRENAAEADRLVRAALARASGMLTQLAQLLGASRAR